MNVLHTVFHTINYVMTQAVMPDEVKAGMCIFPDPPPSCERSIPHPGGGDEVYWKWNTQEKKHQTRT